MDRTTAEIVSFYAAYDEGGGFGRRPVFRLERLRTPELLRAALPPAPARVPDVGGGPGVYARELASSGHAVRLVDLVPEHVAQARTGSPAVAAEVGDARALPSGDREWDATGGGRHARVISSPETPAGQGHRDSARSATPDPPSAAR